MKEEFVKNYLGEEGLAWAKDWYLYALKPEWEYVIFIVRRAYLMAQIMEDVTGESMEKSAAFFLTDAAFFSYYKRLAQFYVTHHRLPNILICEDSVVHGRNIQNFIDSISKAIWDRLVSVCAETRMGICHFYCPESLLDGTDHGRCNRREYGEKCGIFPYGCGFFFVL